MTPAEYDPVKGFQVSSQAVSGKAARAGGRSHNALLWQPPTLARYRFGERGLQMITHCVPTAPGCAVMAMVWGRAGAVFAIVACGAQDSFWPSGLSLKSSTAHSQAA